MLITKITKSYSKSINAKNYGLPESWIKISAEFEGTPEAGDDPLQVGQVLFDTAKKQAVDDTNAVIAKMRAVNTVRDQRNIAPVVPTTTAPIPAAAVVPQAPATALPTVPTTLPSTTLPPMEKVNIGPDTTVDNDMVEIDKSINEITDNGKNPGALFPSTGEGVSDTVRTDTPSVPAANGPRPL